MGGEMQGDFNRRWVEVRARIARACERVGRESGEIDIVALTANFGPDVVDMALNAGITRLGESRPRETAWKNEVCSGRPEWHMVGPMKKGKVLSLLAVYQVFHSVDSDELVRQMGISAEQHGYRPGILIEVNTSAGGSRQGVAPADSAVLLKSAMQWPVLDIMGLSTSAPVSGEAEHSRPSFACLRELRDRLQQELSMELPILCMGESRDFEVAVEEGASWLRLGSPLFGPRQSWSRLQQQIKDNYF